MIFCCRKSQEVDYGRAGGGDWQNRQARRGMMPWTTCLVTCVVTMFPQGIGRKVARGTVVARENVRYPPIGPCLVTTDELQDPSNLRVRMHLNEEAVQDSTTSQLIFDIPTLIEHLRRLSPWSPDLIFTELRLVWGCHESAMFPAGWRCCTVETIDQAIGSRSDPLG